MVTNAGNETATEESDTVTSSEGRRTTNSDVIPAGQGYTKQ